MDASEWLGLQGTHNPMRWVLPITPGISTDKSFLFGGCALGAAIADTFFRRGWAEKLRRSRTVRLTDSGRRALNSQFGAAI